MGAGARGPSTARFFIEWFKAIVFAFVLWLFLRTFVVEAFRIPSGSMKNTLLVGDVLFVNKLLYGVEIPLFHKRLPEVREPKRGDILVFDSVDEDKNMKIVKRLIGMPGDTLEMKNGVVFRNGVRIDEPYTIHTDPRAGADALSRAKMRDWQVKEFAGPVPRDYYPDIHHWGPLVVPRDSFFMMGDNRDDSLDSRFWGFLPRNRVYGRPVLVYFSYDAESWDRFAFVTQIRWKRLFTVPK